MGSAPYSFINLRRTDTYCRDLSGKQYTGKVPCSGIHMERSPVGLLKRQHSRRNQYDLKKHQTQGWNISNQ